MEGATRPTAEWEALDRGAVSGSGHEPVVSHVAVVELNPPKTETTRPLASRRFERIFCGPRVREHAVRRNPNPDAVYDEAARFNAFLDALAAFRRRWDRASALYDEVARLMEEAA